MKKSVSGIEDTLFEVRQNNQTLFKLRIGQSQPFNLDINFTHLTLVANNSSLALLKAQNSLQLGKIFSSDNGVSSFYNVLIHTAAYS